MPVFALDKQPVFPPPSLADKSGLLAVGGKLKPDWLLIAYRKGIFPWFGENEPLMWWSPDPRLVLFPEELRISKSMRPLFNQRKFEVRFDSDFKAVIEACSSIPRPEQEGTWITPEMKDAYIALHELGYAHSVEVLKEGQLVGGLYGVAIGRCFFGESMFSDVSNASKFGFISLVQWLDEKGFTLIDCQVTTEHLQSLGAREISRAEFLDLLKVAIDSDVLYGKWTKD